MIGSFKKYLRRIGFTPMFKIVGDGVAVVNTEMLCDSPQFKKMLIDIQSIKINPQHQR